ncbi:hypothetical protein NKH18_47005 [Streptomyces sp. M10(2022)]
MIDTVVVLRAEDAVLDFLSVLTPPSPESATAPAAGHEVHVLLADSGDHLVLPPGAPWPNGSACSQSGCGKRTSAASPGPDALGAALARITQGRPGHVWTHSPADNRRSRGASVTMSPRLSTHRRRTGAPQCGTPSATRRFSSSSARSTGPRP